MTQDDVIRLAVKADLCDEYGTVNYEYGYLEEILKFAKLVAEHEREALEAELLKLKKGIAANSEYIQGRWDLIGELQDAIRARGQA